MAAGRPSSGRRTGRPRGPGDDWGVRGRRGRRGEGSRSARYRRSPGQPQGGNEQDVGGMVLVSEGRSADSPQKVRKRPMAANQSQVHLRSSRAGLPELSWSEGRLVRSTSSCCRRTRSRRCRARHAQDVGGPLPEGRRRRRLNVHVSDGARGRQDDAARLPLRRYPGQERVITCEEVLQAAGSACRPGDWPDRRRHQRPGEGGCPRTTSCAGPRTT